MTSTPLSTISMVAHTRRPLGSWVKIIPLIILLASAFLAPPSLAFQHGTLDTAIPEKYKNWYWSWRQPPYIIVTSSNGYPYVMPYSVFTVWGGEHNDVLFTGTVDHHADAPYPDGIYQSNNLGHFWEHLGFSFNDNIVSTLVVHPITPTIMLAGTENYYPPGGMYRSGDSGVTWENVLSGRIIYDIEVDPHNPHRIFASTCCGGTIYESQDTGMTWTKISDTALQDLQAHPGIPDLLFGARELSTNPEEGIYRSEDAGVTWTQMSTPRPQPKILIDPNNPNRMFAYGADYYGIQRTTDGGETWTDLTYTLPYLIARPTILTAAIHPQDGSIWIGLKYGGIYVSESNGDTWYELNPGIPFVGQGIFGPQCTSIVINSNGRFAISCDGRVFINQLIQQVFLPVIHHR